MNMKKDDRIQMNNLSKILTGKSCHWQKRLKNGVPTSMEREAKDGSTEVYTGLKYLTVAELKTEMERELQEKLIRDKAEAERKELAAKEETEKALQTLADESQKLNLTYQEEKI